MTMPAIDNGLKLWQTPGVTEINRLPMRSPLIPQENVEGARESRETDSPWLKDLNGKWRFKLVDAPEKALERFFRIG
jgi:hypothetical protein